MNDTVVNAVSMQVDAKSGLNVRTALDASASKVKALAYGSIVGVYEQSNGWSRIDEGQWLSSEYLVPYDGGNNKDNGKVPYPQLASDIGYTEALYQQLRQDEGGRLEGYRCTADKPTIGVGHNLEANGLPVDAEAIWQANPQQKTAYDKHEADCWEGLVITEQQERDLFEHDIQTFENQLQQNLEWYVSLPDNPRCSLTNMCFNMGWNSLSRFKKMLAALEAGDYAKAADEALDSKWASDVGSRSYRVTEQMRSAETVDKTV